MFHEVHVPGACLTCSPLTVMFNELLTDRQVAQFFGLQGLVCPSLFPSARFLTLMRRLFRLLPVFRQTGKAVFPVVVLQKMY